ncbi:TonB C-terminal domain-containing protein [Hyphomicrobium sp. D-2]|uniref:TonB C-terminal domain-containing protein n=1 Tax=Hyphomicrobium sp. D-2 TaxID=3041621 RepID=UPI002454F36B|nr:TonB C-terminal domain-containing protein [Hyphomicrobium sp. D-2]MDH4983959.1 TonB C-terminal domain-containing protein [Hyphomicrobium sp. D-2]
MLRIFLGAMAILCLAAPAAQAANGKAGRNLVVVDSPCGRQTYPKDQLEVFKAYKARAGAYVRSQLLWPDRPVPPGLVCVVLTVRPSGQVLSRRIGKSGGAFLDQLVMRMIANVTLVPPLPKSLSNTKTEMIGIPLRFR